MFVPHQIGDFWSEIYLLLLNTVRVKIWTNKLFSGMGDNKTACYSSIGHELRFFT